MPVVVNKLSTSADNVEVHRWPEVGLVTSDDSIFSTVFLYLFRRFLYSAFSLFAAKAFLLIRKKTS